MATLDTNNDLQVINKVQLQSNDSEYVKLVSHIATLWDNARTNAISAVNSELLDANWKTGQYIFLPISSISHDNYNSWEI